MKQSFLLVAALLLLWSAALTYADSDIKLAWWTVDGGGGTISSGGYTLMGTAGQPDAAITLTGGGYTLAGGFWAAAGHAPAQRVKVYLPIVVK